MVSAQMRGQAPVGPSPRHRGLQSLLKYRLITYSKAAANGGSGWRGYECMHWRCDWFIIYGEQVTSMLGHGVPVFPFLFSTQIFQLLCAPLGWESPVIPKS